jgi:hypothetical protein
LTGAVNDATAIWNLLQTCGYDAIHIPEDQEYALMERVQSIAERIQKNDCFLVYLAGHSKIDTSKTLQRFCLQTKHEDINLKELIDKLMNNHFPKHFLLVLDACESEKSIKLLRQIFRDSITEAVDNSGTEGITMEILSACGNNEKARELNGRGIYTQSLETALEKLLRKFNWTDSEILHAKIKKTIKSSAQIPRRSTIFGGDTHRFKKSGTTTLYKFKWPHNSKTQQVLIAGSFNNWLPLEMHHQGNQWEREFALNKEVEHQYKFIVNEEWMVDSKEPSKIDTAGNRNNILSLY